jgi:alcohol dehydrogenase class IV
MALANAGLGAVHGFAGPIGGMFPAPHGAVCAALLPSVMSVNLRALQQRQPDSECLSRFDDVARCLTQQTTATAQDGVRWLEGLVRDLQIPRLGTYGITAADAASVVEKAAAASSMKGNPLPLTAVELEQALLAAL